MIVWVSNTIYREAYLRTKHLFYLGDILDHIKQEIDQLKKIFLRSS